ncbi:MAG: GAF domain-containing protein [Anaerolineae bacterium]|nr:GAF domain-containing protein [Anaerolineae bacterium]MDQ7033475.1 GAF domain-containing protein [Anaerolineae bacterium]
MSQDRLKNTTAGVLIILTLLSVVVSMPQVSIQVISERFLELGVYMLLTAFALILSVPLSKGELSIAHAIGMIAFLSLDSTVAPSMTIVIFIGSILGSLILMQIHQRSHRRFHAPMTAISIIHIVARVTLSFFVASRLYTALFQATLPISSSTDFQENLIPLIAYGIIYVLLMLLSLILEIQTHIRETRLLVQENIVSLTITLILPVPFAYIGASVARADESIVFFTFTTIGIGFIILGLYVLNQSQERLRRQLDEMRSISVATRALRNNLELNGVLRTAFVQVSQLMDAENFTVALTSETQMPTIFPLVIRNGQEIQVSDGAFPDDYGLIKHIMANNTPLLIRDNVVAKARDFATEVPNNPIQSWLGVPLMGGDKSIGAFVVQSYDSRVFDEDDLRLLNIIVSSTSIAIENARLYHQKSIRAEQLATLNQVMALLTGTLSPSEVLDTIISSASIISEANAVAVFLFTEGKIAELRLLRQAGLSDSYHHQPIMPILTDELSQTAEHFLKPQSMVVSNVEDANVALGLIRQRLKDEGKFAFIENPLVMTGLNLGVLVLYFDKPQIFHDEQIDLIQAFATQAAQAISNARRFTSTDEALEQRVEQLYALAAMGRLLNATMDMNKIYDLVLSYATDATKAPSGVVIIKRSTGYLSVPSQRGYPEDTFQDTSILQHGLTGRVLRNGQPIRTTDIRNETGYLPLIPNTRSLLIVPILKGRDVVGLIMLESDAIAAFSESDSHFVSQIANQAVIAIDNTQLFHRIREARDNMQVILNAMEESVILIDVSGQIALVNPRIDLIALSVDAVQNQVIDTLLEAAELEFAKKLGFANNDAFRNLLTNLRSDDWTAYPPHSYEVHGDEFGVRYIQRQITPVRDDSQQIMGLLLVFYNKTEERELARSRESFSQMIVHDLRSPLTAVTTSLYLLGELVPKDSDFRPLVDKTTTASRRALRKVLARVDSLLDISKMESGEIRLDKEPTPIAQIVDSVRADLKPLAEELEVEIVSELGQNLPLLDIDGDKVERMVLNLVDNALKYSPEKAIVAVRATVIDKDYLQIAIADSGPGIPDEYKRRLFDSFVQVEGRKTVRHGVGLGLTFCKLVVEAHGGAIWIDDNPNGGSIFKATLPIAHIEDIVE